MTLRRLSGPPPAVGAYTSPGSMNNSVTLMQPGQSANDGGPGLSSAWGQTWASIRALTGQELYKAQQIVQEVTHTVVIPYQAGVSAAMQVKMQDGRIFQVKAIADPDEQRRELWLYCLEVNQNAGAAT